MMFIPDNGGEPVTMSLGDIQVVRHADEVAHPLDGLGDAVVAGAEDPGVLLLGLKPPLPRVLERRDLCVGMRAVLLGEQDVVVGVGVEGLFDLLTTGSR
jgi:hypothetical protein